MTVATTMPATDLDDPLGLAALETELTWETAGPLPSWLDGTDLADSDETPAAESPAPDAPERLERIESRVETLAEVGEKTDPRVDMAASGSENRPSSSFNELLALVNLVSQCTREVGDSKEPMPAPAPSPPNEIVTPVNEPAPFGSSHVLGAELCETPPSVETEPSVETASVEMPIAPQPPPRRVPSLEELAAARDCLLVEAGARCWAVPLHAVVCLKPWPASPADIDVDLAEELGDFRPRGRSSRRWMLETTGATFGVDGLRGPGSVAWSSADSLDEPNWMVARGDHCGETVGLIDLGRWRRVEIIPDESEAAALEPAQDPSTNP